MKFHHIAFYADNIEEMVSFYREIFGFYVIKEFRNDEILVGVHLKHSDFVLELLQGTSVKSDVHIAFSVESTSTFYDTYKNTLNFESHPYIVGKETIVFLLDPSGNRIEINDKL